MTKSLMPMPRLALAALAAAGLAHASPLLGATETFVWDEPGVPAPVPLETHVDVAAFVFPGWPPVDRALGVPGGQWVDLLPDPSIKPTLGYYNDELPEVNDWHILWARSFGISLFVFNWYWNDGAQYLEGALEKGFLNATHRDHMDFAIQWSNHPLPQAWGEHTPLRLDREAMLDVVDYWIEHYFLLPNYRMMEGDRPLVFIFQPHLIIEQHGSVAEWRRTLALMNERLAAAGLGPLCLVGTTPRAEEWKAAGFEAMTGYSTHGIPPTCPEFQPGPGRLVPYSHLVQSTHAYWREFTSRSQVLDYILPIGTGWDNSYRHKQGDGLKFTHGFTPAAFEAMIASSPAALQEDGPRMVVFDAWNEWTEGSYLEPDAAFGFGMLEAIARTYGTQPPPARMAVPSPERARSFSALSPQVWDQHMDRPADGPRPPHIDLPMVSTGYRCLGADEKPAGEVLWQWTPADGSPDAWTQLELLEQPGLLAYRATGGDPQVVFRFPPIDFASIGAISFDVVVDEVQHHAAQVYWATPGEEFSREQDFRLEAPASTSWQSLGVALNDGRAWPAQLGSLRLDLGVAGQRVALRSARIHGKAAPAAGEE